VTGDRRRGAWERSASQAPTREDDIARDLTGEVALVTGASKGIGHAIARELAAAGARIAIHYRTGAAEAEALAAELGATAAAGAKGPDSATSPNSTPAVAFRADLENEDETRALHAAVVERLGPVTILIHNAGIWEEVAIDAADALERYRRLMRINLDAAFLLSGLVVPAMRERGRGSILHVSSRAGTRGEARAAHYGTSKGGLEGLVRSLARELGPAGIRVNAIAPGWIVSPMTETHLADPATHDAVVREIPLGRVGTAEDVAHAARFLVSPHASYVTGLVLHVNGGSWMP